jgi:hypothetical protein
MQQPVPGLVAQLRTAEKYTTAVIEAAPNLNAVVTDNFELLPLCPDKCGLVWQGYLNFDQTAGYTFSTSSDDGSRLYIDGQLVVNNDGDHGLTTKTGSAFLQRGWHSVKVVYYNSGGGGAMEVKFGLIGGEMMPIPASMMAH